jgi:hypothetical protein
MKVKDGDDLDNPIAIGYMECVVARQASLV